MISFGNKNNNEYLKKNDAQQIYVQKVIYNNDTSEIESDISNLETRMTTAESNISTNTSNISSLQTQINNLNVGSAYEGLYYSRYLNQYVIVEFNYNIGSMLFWPDTDFYTTPINNVDSTNHVELSNDTKSLILPGTIKKLNSNGTVNTI